VVGRRWGQLKEQVKVNLPGGRLNVRWEGDNKPVWMTGPAETVFEGIIEL
jgi:diaminopimelate epimerase